MAFLGKGGGACTGIHFSSPCKENYNDGILLVVLSAFRQLFFYKIDTYRRNLGLLSPQDAGPKRPVFGDLRVSWESHDVKTGTMQKGLEIRETPWGGGKKRGEENTNDTPPKKRFWTPVQKSTTEQNRSSFGGVQTFSGETPLALD